MQAFYQLFLNYFTTLLIVNRISKSHRKVQHCNIATCNILKFASSGNKQSKILYYIYIIIYI